ncbi:alpha/beta hydrolase [Amycolatopsis samaneae]|uniref:Alpha/beta hydrolase family protein n=1 Tax=Amycolatopsis samaneae TaxID=664691 RepID=A0ABW5GPD1_9PSEU
MRTRLLAFALCLPLVTGASTAFAADGTPGGDDARIVKTAWLDDRLVELTVGSPALGGRAMVRLLLPSTWRAEPRRHWPTLWLMHPGCGTGLTGPDCDYRAWTKNSRVEGLTERTGVIVAMPDAGQAGWFSNWWNGGEYGSPAWETFHLTELPALLKTVFRADGRYAVAGSSRGGFGSISYAARNPGFFAAAAAFSGTVDTTYEYAPGQSVSRQIEEQVKATGADPTALWGDPVKQADIWSAHNPVDLAAKLKGTKLFVSYGTGAAGPLDPPGSSTDPAEQFISRENTEFSSKLAAAGAAVTTDAYGEGTHTWPYWDRELGRALPFLTGALGATSTRS